jgi:hypothetical protein|tara:strand:+ start:328 stop:492 length:165 start_codon:yes stop_codon:yes gene_type:complete
MANHEMKVNSYSARIAKGISKEELGDLNGAFKDWGKAASLENENAAKWVRYQCN